ncbi:hypothetical protein PIB30_050337 [Stylosanthes scabra]|uniref:Uncharacterized protein n=1 Tax=Stylosanthes scabra TaxID=79078 RepID=A0ABU6UJT9_9FABA|nr:hypothetical protein [Stylosanthes scabra]
MIISSTLLSFGVLVSILVYVMQRQMKQSQKASATSDHHDRNLELSFFDISTITLATNNFSTDNILAKGGFRSVYKCGVLCFVCASFHVCILRQRQNFTFFSNSTH